MTKDQSAAVERVKAGRRIINLRDLGFVYRVSDEARAEIEATERRADHVLQTAHLFWFR
jgi:hypothetical protein